MQKTLEIALKHNPVNYGDMRLGNKFDTKLEDIMKNISDTSIVHAVFDNIDDATAFAKEVKEANLGISLVVSAPFDKAWQVADKSGCIGHTIEYSLGILGKTDKLPSPEVNDFCTMCGHGMISRYLVDDCVKSQGRENEVEERGYHDCQAVCLWHCQSRPRRKDA